MLETFSLRPRRLTDHQEDFCFLINEMSVNLRMQYLLVAGLACIIMYQFLFLQFLLPELIFKNGF